MQQDSDVGMDTQDRTALLARLDALETENRTLHNRLENQTNLQEELCRVQRMESLALLVGGVAHDFNNLLQSILGCVQFLHLGKEDEDPDQRLLAQIEALIERGRRLTEQLLSHGKQVRRSFQPMDVTRSIRQVCDLLRRTVPKMIAFETVFADDLPAIEGDAGQIEQVLMNLCLNAIDALPGTGTVTLAARVVRLNGIRRHAQGSVPAGAYVRVTVGDTGCGIPTQVLERMFDPYFSTKQAEKGTGLGLAIVKSIVGAHQGFIECQTTPGQGTRFHLFFPLANRRATSDGRTIPQPVETPANGSERILLVEDESDLLTLGREMLEKYHYTVVTARTGEDAVTAFVDQRFDLVLLDVGMPGMGGLECLRRLLRIDAAARVVIVSGYTSGRDVERAMTLGAKAYLAKPYSLDQLLKTVRSVLDDECSASAAG